MLEPNSYAIEYHLLDCDGAAIEYFDNRQDALEILTAERGFLSSEIELLYNQIYALEKQIDGMSIEEVPADAAIYTTEQD